MAFWVRGGREQTFGPSHGEGQKRPYYYVDDEAIETVNRPLRAFDDDDDDTDDSRHQMPASYHQHVPECDIPYQSIEPRDDTPAETHVFFILHEEGPNEARSLSSLSPLPTRGGSSPGLDRYSPLPQPTTIWKNGSDLKAFATHQSYYAQDSVPVPVAKLPRYEDWRDKNHLHDTATGQINVVRSPSPYEVRVRRAASRRQTPDDTAPHIYAHSHSVSEGWAARSDAQTTGSRDHYQLERQQLDPHIVQSISCSSQDRGASKPSEPLLTDAEAAVSVAAHLASFNRRFPSSRHERILLGLIHPKSVDAEFDLDNSALESIFSSANEIFFNGRLTQRVQWDWSDASSNPQYDNKIIGHTSLRRAHIGGFETFVLLSTPILRSREYSRRLLISAFLHELIHCYLFICCGWSARESGGHTDGFRRIADTIDQWAGRENLFLCQVEADLERFRQPPEWNAAPDETPVVDYSGYSLASPILYNARLCNPTNSNTDWERCLHDRWEHRQHHHGAPSGHTYSWT
ncbi:uncharacterized protein SPSK_04238 [Sporothrix schenckii 1099-18]|uniref:SprT-like domain-containing protein n=1 Tax=Sporothrix schenckii 1099-18 TaxID=1397361 RepID=A0A0F2M1X0_SPOSC|nr:uncharacterized protein SPSK_04238 [Sporothrix schenckii 1099-18]KJR83084.1 hypothetical protein SPSK_04238 [Sporothrix schenckii 1099-18]